MDHSFNAKKLILVCLLVVLQFVAPAQRLIDLNSGTTAHIRGLSVINERVIWASGTGGQVGRSVDGGENWQWNQIPGFSKIDFRDIEAFDEKTAVVMGVGSPGYILRTEDAGKNWSIVYKNEDKRIFLDAMLFWNVQAGIVIGDPIDGRFFILRSFDGGRNWKEIPLENRPIAQDGEACFAASGTNIAAISKEEAVFVSGGTRSRFFRKDLANTLPLMQGSETTGANSISTYQNCGKGNAMYLAVVGGDFNQDKIDSAVCAISLDGGNTWQSPDRPPHGYRSSVVWIGRKKLIACGTSGVDVSEDSGKNWQKISDKGFHVCAKSKSGNTVYLFGASGKAARLEW